MTRIVIDDVENLQDLYAALAAVARAFDRPEMFVSEEEYFSKESPEAPHLEDYEYSGRAAPAPINDEAPPTPYVPCPRRGAHLRLTECWACWCDAHRGACLEVDVLAPDAWDLALAELTDPALLDERPDPPASPDEGGAGFDDIET